jgi:hypothetical protein
VPAAINSSGVVTGAFNAGSSEQATGFVRDASGNITTFSVPGFGSAAPVGINSSGEICGTAYDLRRFDNQAFIRDAEGNLTVFLVPGSLDTSAMAINDSGEVTGWWTDGIVYHGFTRDSSGNFTNINAPGAGSGAGQGTYPRSLNDSGEVTGIGINSPAIDFSFTQSSTRVKARNCWP